MQRLLSPAPLPWAEQGPDGLPWVCLRILNLICISGALGWLPMQACELDCSLFGHFCLQADRHVYVRVCVCVHLAYIHMLMDSSPCSPTLYAHVAAWFWAV